MRITDIPIPEIYLESSDFRFFLRWFEAALTKIQFDTENAVDLFDPQRCPAHLLWMLADTMGYKYDDRLSPAFCRLVLLYFMSMIRYKGSKSGVTLAAEVNLAQFNLQNYENENNILHNRLEDTSIPVNSVYVTAHTEQGYIDVVYFSDKKPVDACIEYVRPLGMYCFQHAGVRFDGTTKISIDARLTNFTDTIAEEGSTRVGHYSREDYARMQKLTVETIDDHEQVVPTSHPRQLAWKRNSLYEDTHPIGHPEGPTQNAGYRALSSLQLCNSEHMMRSLLSPIFDLSYGPQDIEVQPYYGWAQSGTTPDWNKWNLRYNRSLDDTADIRTVEDGRSPRGDSAYSPIPAVNPIMAEIGDAMKAYEVAEFTTSVQKGAYIDLDPDVHVVAVISCKYGDISAANNHLYTLSRGLDYQVSPSNPARIELLSGSKLLPAANDPTKKLKVMYLIGENTRYTKYVPADPEDPDDEPKIVIDDLTL